MFLGSKIVWWHANFLLKMPWDSAYHWCRSMGMQMPMLKELIELEEVTRELKKIGFGENKQNEKWVGFWDSVRLFQPVAMLQETTISGSPGQTSGQEENFFGWKRHQWTPPFGITDVRINPLQAKLCASTFTQGAPDWQTGNAQITYPFGRFAKFQRRTLLALSDNAKNYIFQETSSLK